MAQGPSFQQFRGTGVPTTTQLKAGQWYLDVATNRWYFSTNGSNVISLNDAVTLLSALTDVAISSPADNNLLAYDSASSKWTNQTPAQVGVVPASEKGLANGVATLGSDSKIPASQLPAMAITNVFTVATQAAQLALVAQGGDVAIRSDTGATYIHNGGTAGTIADWTLLPANDTAVDAAHIVSGNLEAARMTANVAAALNSSAAFTINNPNLIFDGGTA